MPADLVMASGSGSTRTSRSTTRGFQLERVTSASAKHTKRDPDQVRRDIEELLRQKAFAPAGGLFGVPMVNVLELNLELRKRYGEPAGSAT